MIDYKAYFTLSYGLYIVSSGDRNTGNGFIANSVFQVTADPPRIAVSCNKNNHTFKFLEKYGLFALSVLAQDASPEIISDFGYKSGNVFDKLRNHQVIYGETGVPVISADCLSYMECKVVQTFEVGTHVIFIGELMHSVMLDETRKCMTYDYYRNVKRGAAPKNAPTYVDKSLLDPVKKDNINFQSYKCSVCGYVYDESQGDESQGVMPGTKFSDVSDLWKCPLCGTGKEDFE